MKGKAMMRALVRLLVVAALSLAATAAHAQSSALIVAACGTQPTPFPVGGLHQPIMDVNGNLCSSATSSGSTFTWPGTAPLTNFGVAPTGTVPAVNAYITPSSRTYNTVAASVTAQALTGGSGGATGDYLSHCVITPGSTSPGTVVILDNATAIYTFAGGASSVSTLISWAVPVGAVSVSGAWKITTGAGVTAFCSGKFS
jgi:hypothetical protein